MKVSNGCEAVCQVYTGGEVKHNKHCIHYPESLTKLNDDRVDLINKICVLQERFKNSLPIEIENKYLEKVINNYLEDFEELLKSY